MKRAAIILFALIACGPDTASDPRATYPSPQLDACCRCLADCGGWVLDPARPRACSAAERPAHLTVCTAVSADGTKRGLCYEACIGGDDG